MKRALILGLGLVSLTILPAAAADIPVKAPVLAPVVAPPFSWTGFYIGVSGGGAWGRSRHTNSAGDLTPTFNVSGGIIGGTVGYNYQVNNWVLGLEGDWSWVSKRGSAVDIPPFNTAFTSETRERWLATGRARVGMTWNQALFYITGGGAAADVQINVCGPAAVGCASEAKTRWGWTVGAGIEYALSQNWSLKGEYLYVNFGNTSYFNPPPGVFADRVGGVFLDDHIFRVGVNYRFNWAGPVVARY